MKSQERVLYSEHFKQQAVKLLVNRHSSVAQVAQSLGVSKSLLLAWKREICAEDESASALKLV